MQIPAKWKSKLVKFNNLFDWLFSEDIDPAYVEEDKDEDDKNDLGEDAIKDKDAKKR